MRRWIALLAIISIAACSTAVPSTAGSTPVPQATPSASTGSPGVVVPAPTPTPTPAASRPSLPPAALPTVSIDLEAAPYVAYAGDPITFTLLGTTLGTIHEDVAVRSATIDFGDGTSVQAGDLCGAGSSVRHAYKQSGRLTATVTAATLCSPLGAIDLSTATTGVALLGTAPPASAAWPTCTTFQLQLSAASLGAAMGNLGDVARVQNRSAEHCQLIGYPSLALISPNGDRLLTSDRPAVDGSYLFPALAARRVALAPGAYASFEIGYTDEPSGSGNNEPYNVACPPASWLRVTLPGTDQYGTLRLSLAPCEGRIDVGPLVAGPGWAGQ
jgi:hypothetical protein